MSRILNFPIFVSAFALLFLWVSEWIGASLRRMRRKTQEEERDDFNLIAAGTLTLLGLIIGFSFSMAISRYDQRKNYEEAEANAIGTEYVRADLLPAADGARVRELMRSYLDQRILFYVTRDERELQRINAATSRLQSQLWSAVQAPAVAQPTPVATLTVSGMNDVLNSQGYTQAAWWNRIPVNAWSLMGGIAICSHLLIGYGMRHTGGKSFLFSILPLVVSMSFFLISDIDSPRRGIIRVRPQNLDSLSRSLSRH